MYKVNFPDGIELKKIYDSGQCFRWFPFDDRTGKTQFPLTAPERNMKISGQDTLTGIRIILR